MKIAIIGTGNVGATLAAKWAAAGHQICLGVKDTGHFKGEHLMKNPRTSVHSVSAAVEQSEVVLLATPAPAAIDVTKSLGDTRGKIIIDAMNVVMGNGPKGFTTTTEAILANTATTDVVKCFNTTGFNNMEDPVYEGIATDMFVCGDSVKGKELARQLALDVDFGECYDVGGNDKFELMEQFAWFWINLAMFQGQGREMAFKLFKR